MGTYLRDTFISDVRIDEAAIKSLAKKITACQGPPQQGAAMELMFIIRFDGKGYRVGNTDDLISHFREARVVERLIITSEDGAAKQSNRANGTAVDLRFDKHNPQNSSLTVTADDKNWVETEFPAIQDILNRYKTKNGWARTTRAAFGVQLFGVVLLFSIGIWIARAVSPYLKVDDAFVVSLLFLLLIFSNVWTYVYPRLLNGLNTAFPSIDFYRPHDGFMKKAFGAIIIAACAAFAIYILQWVARLAWKMLASLFGAHS